MNNYLKTKKTSIYNLHSCEFKSLESLPFHKNIVQIYSRGFLHPSRNLLQKAHAETYDALCDSNGKPRETMGIEMEYFPFDLESFLEKYRPCLNHSDIYNFCHQISEGVSFLYSQKVVHLDLKLNNLLVSPCLTIAICDFSCAKQFNDSNSPFIDLMEPDEAEGGNIDHLAIEIFNSYSYVQKGKLQMKKVDYTYQPSFALGVLFYEIATGKDAFREYPLGKRPNCTIPYVDFSLLKGFNANFVELIKKLICPPPRPLPAQIQREISSLLNTQRTKNSQSRGSQYSGISVPQTNSEKRSSFSPSPKKSPQREKSPWPQSEKSSNFQGAKNTQGSSKRCSERITNLKSFFE